jgi:cytochrome P450
VESARRVSAGWAPGETVDLTAAFQEVTFDALMGATLGMGTADCPPALRAELLRFVSGQLSSGMFFASAVMGPTLYARLRGTADTAKDALRAGSPLVARTPLAARAHNLARVEVWLADLVAARRADPVDGPDALSRLIAEGDAFSDTDVVQQLLTLLIAGHDTTSLALSWVAAQLMARPALLAEVVAEAVACEAPESAESAAVALPLLYSVVQESLRFTPGAAVAPRRLLVDKVIAGETIRAGTVVAANVIGAHSRVETWGDPEVFRPARFREGPPAANTFFPFGGGLRRCLGAAFAQAEMPLVLAVLLRSWAFSPVTRLAPIPSIHGFLIGPARNVRARLQQRSDA